MNGGMDGWIMMVSEDDDDDDDDDDDEEDVIMEWSDVVQWRINDGNLAGMGMGWDGMGDGKGITVEVGKERKVMI